MQGELRTLRPIHCSYSKDGYNTVSYITTDRLYSYIPSKKEESWEGKVVKPVFGENLFYKTSKNLSSWEDGTTNLQGSNLTLTYRFDTNSVNKIEFIPDIAFKNWEYIDGEYYLFLDKFIPKSEIGNITQLKLEPNTNKSESFLLRADLYSFEFNQLPSISGKDESLGNISDEINYKYTVFDEDGDTLSVVERLNNTVTNVRNDVKSGTEFTLNIPKEDIYKLPIGQTNKISIEVSDGQEKVYRNLTFIRTNTAPVIQVLSEKDLGEIIAPFTSKVKIHDEEGDNVNLVYTVNQIVLDKNNEYKRVAIHSDSKEAIALDSEIDYSIPIEIFKTMNIGKYELSIKAIDAETGENEEVIKFTRTEDTIDFETKSIETETMPKQFISIIQIAGTPTNIKIMACNNGLDSSPAWEDITDYALDGSPYTFKNTTKTAAKWAVKAKVNIDGKEVK